MRALLLALLLTACGGGGSSSTGTPPLVPVVPIGTHTFPDFFPHLSGKTGSATAIWRASGQVLTSYTFKPLLVTWGTATEHWALTTCNGAPWVTILGYQDGTGPIWAATSVRTTWDGVELTCTAGAPYAPVDLVPGVHTLRQWGRIADARDYYWQSEFTFGGVEMNPCWTGAEPSRPVIVQREIWQDRGGATARGTLIGDPWLVTPQAIYDYRATAGLGAGYLWTAADHTGEFCLQSLTIQ